MPMTATTRDSSQQNDSLLFGWGHNLPSPPQAHLFILISAFSCPGGATVQLEALLARMPAEPVAAHSAEIEKLRSLLDKVQPD